jgi:beta-lactamase regulating signal transducer with metallopeptidase domain
MANLIAVIHWFNPLAWLLRREVKTLHEYEADRCTLTQGIDATRYKLLLIEKAAGASRYSVASSFAQSKIKKRIVMMNNQKQNPNPWARWKVLLFIPLAALLMQCFARPEVNRELEQISEIGRAHV